MTSKKTNSKNGSSKKEVLKDSKEESVGKKVLNKKRSEKSVNKDSLLDASSHETSSDMVKPMVVEQKPLSALEFEDQTDSCEVYDEVDQANLLQMAQTEQILASIRQRVAPERHPDFNGVECVECGDKIPKERLAMGKVRCVSCQSEREERQKQFGRLF